MIVRMSGRDLYWASYKTDLSQVQALVRAGADVNYRDGVKGVTPLMAAVFKNHPLVAEYLLSIPELNCSIRDSDGWTALHCACVWGGGGGLVSAIAARMDSEGLNTRDRDNDTAVMCAVRNANTEAVRALGTRQDLEYPYQVLVTEARYVWQGMGYAFFVISGIHFRTFQFYQFNLFPK